MKDHSVIIQYKIVSEILVFQAAAPKGVGNATVAGEWSWLSRDPEHTLLKCNECASLTYGEMQYVFHDMKILLGLFSVWRGACYT